VALVDNYARIGGGALYSAGYGNNAGAAHVTAGAFVGNAAQSGGAVYLAGSSAALIASGSLFEQNAAAEFFSGGALFVPVSTKADVVNSTFAQNSGGSGSAIQADGTLRLSFVTIAQNATASGSGGALQVSASGPVQQLTVKNSIVADNDGGAGNCQLGLGTMTAAGADLSSDASCTGFSLNETDPQLAPLAGHGTGATYALSPGSAAVDAVEDCTDAQAAPVVFDQRGMPRAQGSACDIGAFELGDRVFVDGFEIIVN
jgi:predicted outer membrane repeat protein